MITSVHDPRLGSYWISLDWTLRITNDSNVRNFLGSTQIDVQSSKTIWNRCQRDGLRGSVCNSSHAPLCHNNIVGRSKEIYRVLILDVDMVVIRKTRRDEIHVSAVMERRVVGVRKNVTGRSGAVVSMIHHVCRERHARRTYRSRRKASARPPHGTRRRR